MVSVDVENRTTEVVVEVAQALDDQQFSLGHTVVPPRTARNLTEVGVDLLLANLLLQQYSFHSRPCPACAVGWRPGTPVLGHSPGSCSLWKAP